MWVLEGQVDEDTVWRKLISLKKKKKERKSESFDGKEKRKKNTDKPRKQKIPWNCPKWLQAATRCLNALIMFNTFKKGDQNLVLLEGGTLPISFCFWHSVRSVRICCSRPKIQYLLTLSVRKWLILSLLYCFLSIYQKAFQPMKCTYKQAGGQKQSSIFMLRWDSAKQ